MEFLAVMNVAWMVGLKMTAYEHAVQEFKAELAHVGKCYGRCFEDRAHGLDCWHQQQADLICEGFEYEWHSYSRHVDQRMRELYEAGNPLPSPEVDPWGPDDIPF